MTVSRFFRSRRRRFLASAAFGLLALSACSSVPPAPNAQSIAGLTPSGRVSMTQLVVEGMAGGSGTLTFNGQNYGFKLLGSVVGPGGAAKTEAVGEVYRLNNLLDFGGLYSESTGKAGLERSGMSELWLENKAGVILHLIGTTQGIVLTLGRNEVEIRLMN